MSHDPNDVVNVYSGSLMAVEARHQVLTEAGVKSKVVGSDLSGSFGSVLPASVELWVHSGDVEKATAAILAYEHKKTPKHHTDHPHPTSDPKPDQAPIRKENYKNPNPGS